MKEYDISNLIELLKQYRPLTEFNRNLFYEKNIKDNIFHLYLFVEDVEKYGKVKGGIPQDANSKYIGSFSHYLIRIELEVLPSEKNKLTRINRNDKIQIKGKINEYIHTSDSVWWYSINMFDCILIL